MLKYLSGALPIYFLHYHSFLGTVDKKLCSKPHACTDIARRFTHHFWYLIAIAAKCDNCIQLDREAYNSNYNNKRMRHSL